MDGHLGCGPRSAPGPHGTLGGASLGLRPPLHTKKSCVHKPQCSKTSKRVWAGGQGRMGGGVLPQPTPQPPARLGLTGHVTPRR